MDHKKDKEQNEFITKSYFQTWLLFYVIAATIVAFTLVVVQFKILSPENVVVSDAKWAKRYF